MLLQGSATPIIRTGLRAAYGYLVVYSGLLVFGLMCLIWSVVAAFLGYALSEERGKVVGRSITSWGFRCYLYLSTLTVAIRFVLGALDDLSSSGHWIICHIQDSHID